MEDHQHHQHRRIFFFIIQPWPIIHNCPLLYVLRSFNYDSNRPNVVVVLQCANTYRNQIGQQNVAGCIIDNIKAWASNDNTTTQRRRRRALDIGGLYTISQARIFYSTACASQSDRGKNATSPYLSRCASQRLAACNKLYNNPASLTPWAIPPTSMAYSVVDTYFTSFVIIAVYQVFGVSPTHALSVANNNNNNFGLTANITNLLSKQKFIKLSLDFENECLFF